MVRLNILVTGVGAIIGYGIINALRKTNRKLRIVGTDIYEDAVGRYFCDTFIPAKRADSIDYLDFLCDIITSHQIDLVFFGTEQEIYKVSDARRLLTDIVDRLVLNSKWAIGISKDKFKTYLFLRKHGFEAIRTRLDGSYSSLVSELGTPFLLKLRDSYASKGIVQIDCEDDYDYWKKKMGDSTMAQELIGDDENEYTCGVFVFGSAKCLPPFILRRTMNRDGATQKAVVENIPELASEIGRLVKIFKPIGPTNFQFRLHQGKYLLLEVNPRISSSTSIRTAFGYNEAELSIQYFLEHRDIRPPAIQYGSAIRYYADWINYEHSVDF